jgi:hypothetical protein
LEGLAGHELEGYGQRMFGHMRLSCFHRLNQARLIELQPGGAYSPSEHVEFDYLIPRDNVCLVVETTGRRGPAEVRRKDDRLRRHYSIVDSLPLKKSGSGVFWVFRRRD